MRFPQFNTPRGTILDSKQALQLLELRPRERLSTRQRRGEGCKSAERDRESTTTDGNHFGKNVIVRSLRPARQAAPPPEPVPVEHSPAYLLRNCSRPEPSDLILARSKEEEPFTGNAVEWAVRRLDASLDEAELDPPPGAKAIIDVARGPVGTATVQGVTAAARVTVKVGSTALKAAAPVGKWVVQQSFKAALGVLSSDGAKMRQKK